MAESEMLTLFTTNYSPVCNKVEIVLREKQIPYTRVEVDLTNKPQELLDANPIYKKVPTIIHNGKGIPESAVILEYLEEEFPEYPLLPALADHHERARCRFWMSLIDQNFIAMLMLARTKPDSPEREAGQEAAKETFRTLEKGLTASSAEGPFFMGEQMTLVDVAFAPFVSAQKALEQLVGINFPGADECPRVHRWIEALSTHPSVVASLPDVELIMERVQRMIAGAAEAAAAART